MKKARISLSVSLSLPLSSCFSLSLPRESYKHYFPACGSAWGQVTIACFKINQKGLHEIFSWNWRRKMQHIGFKLSDLWNEQVALRVSSRRATITVDLSVDAALSEEQAVLGEGSCLVSEQVAHLTELLAQRGVSGLRRCVRLLPIHL